MSVVDDLRKLLQDLVTPDLRALAVRVEHIEKSLAELRGEMRAQADATRDEVRAGVARIGEILRIEQRLSAVEDEQRKKLPERGQ